ncbi:30S ribosomal protein S21 [Flavobacterium okayamense]|uniref:Small ribosomal subunit protein bS21 n=1 Tax=Flavobacterium okayamense TaxID=2830782 RepID=A0ABM7S8S3_9FLAO|nr:30S ribosomal protein S21 [Flavobacterium okayamense]BCY29327.1 30S ribosomal protein S21 [Flavobacterium okayamense]
MLIVEVKSGENIERALKKFKNKVRKVKQVQQLRENQHFTKKSVARREEVSKAKYIQHLKDETQD